LPGASVGNMKHAVIPEAIDCKWNYLFKGLWMNATPADKKCVREHCKSHQANQADMTALENYHARLCLQNPAPDDALYERETDAGGKR
jgi:hypothetical protein